MIIKIINKSESSFTSYKAERFELKYGYLGKATLVLDNNVKSINIDLNEKEIFIEDEEREKEDETNQN